MKIIKLATLSLIIQTSSGGSVSYSTFSYYVSTDVGYAKYLIIFMICPI